MKGVECYLILMEIKMFKSNLQFDYLNINIQLQLPIQDDSKVDTFKLKLP